MATNPIFRLSQRVIPGSNNFFVLAGLVVVLTLLAACKNNDGEEPSGPVLFERVDPEVSGVKFKNTLLEKTTLNILYYLYYYNGGGVAVGDINNDGLVDIYFTANHSGGNKLYLNKGNLQFEDITAKAGVAGNAEWSTGVTMADVNGDGLLDIYVCVVNNQSTLSGKNMLFVNNGDETFKEEAAAYRLDFSGLSTQAAFFDYDRDGDPDMYLLNHSRKPHENVVNISNRMLYDSLGGDRFYRNEINSGKAVFTDVSKDAGIYQSSLGYGLGIAVADFNNDGWDDVYIGNDFHENDYYYLNTGGGGFAESGAEHFMHYSRFSMGNDAADFNNDGFPDIITLDMLPPDEKTLKTYGSDENPNVYKAKLGINGYQHQFSRNVIQRNNQNGTSFSDVALMGDAFATDWSWSPLFADFDNDGNKDLFISSGIVKRPLDLDYMQFLADLRMRENIEKTDKFDTENIGAMPDGASKPFFFKGDGHMQFKDMSINWGTGKLRGYFNGAAYADLDNDGDLDVVINAIDQEALMLENKSANTRFLAVNLEGDSLNRYGLGTKAWLFSAGKIQLQAAMATRGFMSASQTTLHFGLGNAQPDSVLIVWPDQRFQLIRNPEVNKKLTVKQDEASGRFDFEAWFPLPQSGWEKAGDLSGWKHQENDFVDFNRQYLIPQAQSTRGPKLAVGDINNDGLEDFYVCGAKGQSGALYMQSPSGNFSLARTGFVQAAEDEMDALIFDANGDGWNDLFVVSGGNEADSGDLGLKDRFFLNLNGMLTESPERVPAILVNKSCVATADYDGDGDADLFIGGLADAGKYGYPQNGYFLLNDGSGNFTVDTMRSKLAAGLGIITSAAFADLDGDGLPDLVVAGEWMPVKIFTNNKISFQVSDLPASSGLWQSLLLEDVNEDGRPDILAGNWGENSKRWARKNGPVKLFVKDFDNNGITEQILTYTIDGKDYALLGKDELERALPVLKKAYLTYSEVAGKDVKYMFYDLFENYLELKAETLSSTIFVNDGSGGFRANRLPSAFQLAPVMSISKMAKPREFLFGGNYFGVVPYEGRYDALVPTVLSTATGENWQAGVQFADITGEFRDAGIIIGREKTHLVIARNNRPVQLWKMDYKNAKK